MLIKNLLNKNKPNVILITTDLEADDIIALTLFAKQLNELSKTDTEFIKDLTLIFLVGEGEYTELKKQRMFTYLKILGLESFTTFVYSGYGSEKKFQKEGTKMFTSLEISEFAKIPTIKHNQFVPTNHDLNQLGRKFQEMNLLNSKSNLLVISLKPMTELIWLWTRKYLCGFYKKYFIGYMSFNARKLFSYNNIYRELIPNCLESFDDIYLYETFPAVGSQNNLTADKFDFTKLPKSINDDVTLWNQNCLDDMIKSLNRYFDEVNVDLLTNNDIDNLPDGPSIRSHTRNSLKRSLKAAKSIKKDLSTQFVNADTALIFWLFTENDLSVWEYNINGELYFTEEGYTTLKCVDNSSHCFRMLTSEDKQEQDTLRDLQCKFYKDTLLL